MEEFKCQMAIQMKINPNGDDTILRYQSVTCLSLVKDGIEAGDTPCWLLVINLCALRAIDDPIGKYSRRVIDNYLKKQDKHVTL